MTLIEKILKLANPDQLGYAGNFWFMLQVHVVLGIMTLVIGGFMLVTTKGTTLHKKVGLAVVIILKATLRSAWPCLLIL